MSASIFSLSCDLDWNTVCEQVIPSPQLWGLSVARGASVFCHISPQSTAEKENGANRAFQSPIYLPPHLSTEKFYRNYSYGCTAEPSMLRAVLCLTLREGMLRQRLLQNQGQGRGRVEHGNQAAQLTQPHRSKLSKPSPKLQPVLPQWLTPAHISIPRGLLLL